jgi:hypothetical protein
VPLRLRGEKLRETQRLCVSAVKNQNVSTIETFFVLYRSEGLPADQRRLKTAQISQICIPILSFSFF